MSREWQNVKEYLVQCLVSHAKQFHHEEHFKEFLKDGVVLCKYLQYAFLRKFQSEQIWTDICARQHLQWPGYKERRQAQLSQFMLERNVEFFIRICATRQEIKVPNSLLFRSDELYQCTDMHQVYKLLSFLSQNKFMQEAYPKSRPFKVARRNFTDHGSTAAMDMIYCQIDTTIANPAQVPSQQAMQKPQTYDDIYSPMNQFAQVPSFGQVDFGQSQDGHQPDIYSTLVGYSDSSQVPQSSPNAGGQFNRHGSSLHVRHPPGTITGASISRSASIGATDGDSLRLLPPREFQELQKVCSARFHVLQELRMTEKNFVENALKKVVKIQEICQRERLLTEREVAEVFLNFENLTKLHQDMSAALNAMELCECAPPGARANGKHEFDGNFVDLYGILEPYYRVLCPQYLEFSQNCQHAQQAIKHKLATKPELKRRVDKELTSGSLADMLFLPMQRLMKYQLMIKEYNKNLEKTKKKLEDYMKIDTCDQTVLEKMKSPEDLDMLIESTNKALQLFLSLCTFSNTVVRDVEDKEKSDAIHGKIPNLFSNSNNERLYIEWGLCRLDNDLKVTMPDNSLTSEAKRRRVFLFDRLIIVTSRSRNPKVLKRYAIEDYELQPVVKSSAAGMNASNHGKDTSVFTFFTQDWPHKFAIKKSAMAETLTRSEIPAEIITFCAATEKIRDDWVSAIKQKQERIECTKQNYHPNWIFQMKTFPTREGLHYCDFTDMVLPGLYLQGVHARPNVVSSQNIPTYNIKVENVCDFIKSDMAKSTGRRNRERPAPLGIESKLARLNVAPHNQSTRHRRSIPVSESETSEDDHFWRERLDDYDWYAPQADRTSFPKWLKTQSWVNGAFLVRSSRQTTYALTVIYCESGRQPSDPTRDAKHISIVEMGDDEDGSKRYYINDRENHDCKFESIPQLIQYYKTHSLSEHFNDLNTTLRDVFQESQARQPPPTPRLHNGQSRHFNTAQTMQQPKSRPPLHVQNSNGPALAVRSPPFQNPSTIQRTIWQVRTVPRKYRRNQGGNTYPVHGYCRGTHPWEAQDDNQFSVAVGQYFCIVGDGEQGWMPVVPIPDVRSWATVDSQQREGYVKRYIPEQYVQILTANGR